MAAMTPEQKSLLNATLTVVLTVVAADYIYVGLFHNKPIIEALEPFMGFLAAACGAACVYAHLKHHPLL